MPKSVENQIFPLIFPPKNIENLIFRLFFTESIAKAIYTAIYNHMEHALPAERSRGPRARPHLLHPARPAGPGGGPVHTCVCTHALRGVNVLALWEASGR